MPFKDKEKKKEYQRNYQKKWKEENKDRWNQIRKKSDSRPEAKEKKKKWWKESPKAKLIRERFKENNPNAKKEICRRWNKNNPDKVKEKFHKYYLTLKGTVNRLKKNDYKRFKINNKEITTDLIKLVNYRDKSCVYCRNEFKNLNYIEYDHINPFKPFSKFNMVRCCKNCNRSKLNANVFEWCKFKGYTPVSIIFELYRMNLN